MNRQNEKSKINKLGFNVPINCYEDGTCRTIKSQYAKTGVDNFKSESTFGASGVLRVEYKADE